MKLTKIETALITMLRNNLLPEDMETLTKGPPISSANDVRVVDVSHPYFSAIRELVAGQGNSRPEDLHMAHGDVDGKLSVGITPVVRKIGGRAETRVALQRRMQEQIGLGQGAKWAMATGGFVRAGQHEPAEAAILRNAKDKGGVVVSGQNFPVVYLITKEPYGVTNEGYAQEDGKVLQGNIYGTVGRSIVNVSEEQMQAMMSYAAGRGEEIHFFAEEEFADVIDNGHHTLDVQESEFVEAIFGDVLSASPTRYILSF